MQPPPQSASQYLDQAEALRKIAAELEPTDPGTAASLLEIAVENVVKARNAAEAACEPHLTDIGKRAS